MRLTECVEGGCKAIDGADPNETVPVHLAAVIYRPYCALSAHSVPVQ